MHRLRVVYKSGATQEFNVEKYSFRHVDGRVASGTWTTCRTNDGPVIIGINDIAAIYEVPVKWWRR